MEYKGLPVFNICLNDNTDENEGLSVISIVSDPAVCETMMMFSNEERKQMIFANDTNEMHCITSVALLADCPIYRVDEYGNGYYVVFQQQTIRDLVEKYSKDGYNNLVSFQHNGEIVNDFIMLESYFVDKEKGLAPTQFDVSDGSWIVTYKCTNEDTWNKVKNELSNGGYSVEINCTIEPAKDGQILFDEPESDTNGDTNGDTIEDADFWNWLDELLKALEDNDCEIAMESDKKKESEWLIDGDGEYWIDDDGNKVPSKCPKCGGDVVVSIQGEPIFKCKECGEYLGTVMFPDELDFELDFEVERTDIARAIDKGNQVKLKIGDGKIETAQIHSLGKKGNSDIAIVYYPDNNRWADVPLKDISVLEPTKTPNIAFPDVPKAITDNDDITIQRNVNTMSYSELIHNRIPVMLTYDDDKPNPHTGYRQCAIIAYGYTKANNECIRIMETFGDSRSAAEGEGVIPDYRLMLVRRIKSFKPMQGVQSWSMDILDSRVNMNGDRSMRPCLDHIKLSDFD